MYIDLEKSSGKSICRSKKCTKDPNFISSSGRIKSGTTCAAITMCSASGFNTSYYCYNCMQTLYADVKKVLDPKLWVFH